MIKGIGIDLLEIGRMSRLLERRLFMERVFTDSERKYIYSKGNGAARSAAGIFCAKEAYAKAAGKGLMSVLGHMEVSRDERGAPYICVPRGGKMERADGCFLSISHTETTAAAVVAVCHED